MSKSPNLVWLALTQPIRKRPYRAKRVVYTYGDYLSVLPLRFIFNESEIFRYLCYGTLVGLCIATFVDKALWAPANVANFKKYQLDERMKYETKWDSFGGGSHH